MSNNFLPIQLQDFQLSGAGASIADETILISNFTDIDGNALTMADFGIKGYGTLEPGFGEQEESITFSGITNNGDGTSTLTGVKHALFKSPYTETAGLTKSHAGGTKFVISNTAPFYNDQTSFNNDETITGIWSFTEPNYPRMATTVTPPVTDGEFATKKYADDLAIAGSPKATEAVYGITRLSTAAASAVAPIAVGDNDARVPTTGENNALVGNNTDIAVGTGNKFVTQTGLQHSAETYGASAAGTDTYAVTLSPIPTSYTAGMTVRFKADVANTGACTLNVNGLGAVPIQKAAGTALADNEILAGQMVEVVYNDVATDYFQLIGASLITPANVTDLTDGGSTVLHTHTYKNGQATKDISADAAQTIAHGLGKVPSFVRIMIGGPSQTLYIGSYNGTSTSSIGIGCVSTTDIIDYSTTYIGRSYTVGDTGKYSTAVLTIDATNITLTWTKTSTASGTAIIDWEAYF